MADSFLEQVKRAVARRRLLAGGERVGVAVSGGSDSVALLEALAGLAPELDLRLVVLHLNHNLRGAESDADERFVRELAAARDLACRVESVDVAASAARGNLEQAGRRARYRFFAARIAAGDCDRVATGHTRSDQAETVLFRLLRGAGASGLAAVRAQREPGVIRPLLDVSRDDARRFLIRRGVAWRDDTSNRDLRLARNRIRSELLPALRREWNPRLDEALARTAEQAADEEAWWAEQVDALEDRLVERRGETVELSAAAVAALHPALQRRLFRRLAGRLLPGGESALGFDAVERLRELVVRPGGAGGCSLPGLAARRSLDRIRLARARAGVQPDAEAWARPLAPPCSRDSLDGLTRLEIQVLTPVPKASRYTDENRCFLDWSGLPRPLTLRCVRAGDRLPAEDDREAPTLRRLLQAAGVPEWERAAWPVVAAGPADEPVWTRGWGGAPRYRAGDRAVAALAVRETDRRGREIRSIEDWTRSVYIKRRSSSETAAEKETKS